MRFKKKLLATILPLILSYPILNPVYAFTTNGGKIYDGIGNEVAIDGVAWIGFQDSNFLGGLWNVPFNPFGTQHGVSELLQTPWNVPGSNITSPSGGAVFKTIRLAMQPGIWHSANTTQQSPFDFSRTDINNKTSGNGPFCDWTQGADASGHCLKSKTAAQLLNTTITEFGNKNILVMLDVHHRPGLGDNFRDGTVVAADYSLQTYHDDMAAFAKNAPANVLGIDIYNEPHNLYWYNDNPNANPTAQPSWIKVIAAAAAAAYDNNQNLLLFVEGPDGTAGNDQYDPVYNTSRAICLPSTTQVDDNSVIGLANDPAICKSSVNQNKTHVSTLRVTNIGVNWGENFRPLLDPTQSINGIAKFDVNTFRNMLKQAIIANNFSNTDPDLIANWLLGKNNDGVNGHIVFAPHLYGSQVAGWQSDANDSQIRFKWNFGFLLDSGFPIVIGELGYDVQVPQKGGEDFFLDSVKSYLVSKNINHNLFFWTWNNADSPVGLRASDSDLTLFAWKEKDLHDLFNAIIPVPTYGKLCVTVLQPNGYTGASFPIITANGNSNYTFNMAAFNAPLCLDNVLTGSYHLTGSTIVNTDGLNYIPSQTYITSVSENNETDVNVEYAQQPTGSLQVSVTGDATCAITQAQSFTVTYTNNTLNKQVMVTTATPQTVTVPVGSYTVKVTPDPLTTNTQCKAVYNQTVTIISQATTNEAIHYVYTPPGACTVDAHCSTWGTPNDSWAGSSCNFYIHAQNGMTVPTTFTLVTAGITGLVQPAWGATATFNNGTVVMQLTNPVYNNNVGFNATGIIQLPSQSTLVTNGQTLTCPIVAN